MSDPIIPEVSTRICRHMNDDHADAVLLYAKTFGNTPNATAAELVSIDPEGMNLTAKIENDSVPIRIAFERTLADSEDAHQTLIAMVKQARSQGQ